MRRRAGWLPGDQDELEAWLAGHRERVDAKGEQAVLHPVLTEFQELIHSDPVVRMYLNQMIAQVPRARQYRKRHLQSVQQMLRLINEVLKMAPEYSEDAMVVLPLGAILDWEMGTPAGFAAFRDRQINAMIKKILTAWCEFLTSSDSRYVLNNSSSGWRCTTARRAVGIEQYLGGGRGIPACLRQGQTLRGENHGCPTPYLRLRESAFQPSFPTLNLYVAGLFETGLRR